MAGYEILSTYRIQDEMNEAWDAGIFWHVKTACKSRYVICNTMLFFVLSSILSAAIAYAMYASSGRVYLINMKLFSPSVTTDLAVTSILVVGIIYALVTLGTQAALRKSQAAVVPEPELAQSPLRFFFPLTLCGRKTIWRGVLACLYQLFWYWLVWLIIVYTLCHTGVLPADLVVDVRHYHPSDLKHCYLSTSSFSWFKALYAGGQALVATPLSILSGLNHLLYL
eukprot:gb/GEZN01015700.1/.p1 GENE.gb/GEZN01015700.1/~~gb/GEZN01015700.1/.p1  ORF type:complete len:251 (-),score=24.73 gb/GEZN01015700.1/:132-806(-)